MPSTPKSYTPLINKSFNHRPNVISFAYSDSLLLSTQLVQSWIKTRYSYLDPLEIQACQNMAYKFLLLLLRRI